MDISQAPEVEYEAYNAQKKAFYSRLYTPKALREDFSSLSTFATDFLAYSQEKLGLECKQFYPAKKGYWDCGAVIHLHIKLYQRKNMASLYLGSILDEVAGKKIRTFWISMHPLSAKKKPCYHTQVGAYAEVLEALRDYLLINALVKTHKKYFEINKKAVPVGSVLLLGKKFLVHPYLLSELDIVPDYGEWADAKHWTMMANMPLRIKMRKIPIETLKAEDHKLTHLIGRSKWHESLQISIYYEQSDAIRTTVEFLSRSEDQQKFRIREESKLKKRRKKRVK